MPHKPVRGAKNARKRKPTRVSVAAELKKINAMLDRRLEMIEELQHTCTIQFQRIAQIQAELDEIKKRWPKPELPLDR